MLKKVWLGLSLGLLCVMPSGCVPLALTAVGVGMATGVSHTLGGIVYKTFSAPRAQVKHATLMALNRMQIKVTETTKKGDSEIVVARAGDRNIEIDIEALTPGTTRMSVTAKKDGGLLRDGATATEIILQTEKLMGTN